MTNPDYLYRVTITSFPEGALYQPDPHDTDYLLPDPDWHPPGWRPRGRYTEILGTDRFIWPVTNKTYHSRSTAKKRADLIESFGATAVVERSSKITWPEAS